MQVFLTLRTVLHMVFARDLKNELLIGGMATGLIITELGSPMVGPMLHAAGVDFMIVDMEHGSFCYEAVAAMIAACRGTRIVPYVRIPEIRRECITKVLDAGAQGVLVPGIESAHDVERCVEYARYAPAGRRGVSLRKCHTGFSPSTRVAYTAEANRRIMIMGQIETTRGVEMVDELAAADGLDLLFIGPSDLTHCLSPTSDNNVDVLLDKALATIIDAGKRHGKIIGVNTADAQVAAKLLAQGVRFVSMGTDVGSFIDACAAKMCRYRASFPALESR